jgi:hypothetical protein
MTNKLKGTPKNYFVYFDFYREPQSLLKLRLKIVANDNTKNNTIGVLV